MNRWQQVYCDTYYDGKVPRTKRGKMDMALLEKVKSQVTVEIPGFEGVRGFVPAHKETFTVTENDCDIPNGKISVCVLVGNLDLWLSRGWKVTTR